jgi:hypothetical protein
MCAAVLLTAHCSGSTRAVTTSTALVSCCQCVHAGSDMFGASAHVSLGGLKLQHKQLDTRAMKRGNALVMRRGKKG